MFTGLFGAPVYSLLVDPSLPDTVYAGSDYGHVAKSTDAGASWHSAYTGLPLKTMVVLAADPLSPATIYAATDGDGVYKTTTGGEDWAAAKEGLAANIHALVVDPVTSSTLYAAATTAVYKSVDSGAHWALSSTGIPGEDGVISALVIDPKIRAGSAQLGQEDVRLGWKNDEIASSVSGHLSTRTGLYYTLPMTFSSRRV